MLLLMNRFIEGKLILMKKWDDLPENMKRESVRKYYEILQKKNISLFSKRVFDIVVAIITFIILSPTFVIISIAIKLDSKGPIFFSSS